MYSKWSHVTNEKSLADNIKIARIKNGKSKLMYRFAREDMCSRDVDKASCILNPRVRESLLCAGHLNSRR